MSRMHPWMNRLAAICGMHRSRRWSRIYRPCLPRTLAAARAPGLLLWLPILALGLAQAACAPGPAAPVVGGQLSLLAGAKPARPTQPAPQWKPVGALQPAPAELPAAADPGPASVLQIPSAPNLTQGGFPTPTAPPALPSAGREPSRPDESGIGRLIIPKMSLDAAVRYVPFSGDTWPIEALRWEVAWMGDTSSPGLGGNTALAAHVDFSDGSAGPFWNLSRLQPGDRIQVFTEQNRYTYAVRERITVDETDLSVIAPTNGAQITLITCAGWDPGRRAYVQRLVVFADLVEIDPLARAN